MLVYMSECASYLSSALRSYFITLALILRTLPCSYFDFFFWNLSHLTLRQLSSDYVWQSTVDQSTEVSTISLCWEEQRTIYVAT